MTIEQTDVIDFIGVHQSTGIVRLTIADHLEWSDERHLDLLNEKLNGYVDFIRNQLPDQYPDFKEKPVEVHLACKYLPGEESRESLENVRRTLHEMGIDFFWRIHGSDDADEQS